MISEIDNRYLSIGVIEIVVDVDGWYEKISTPVTYIVSVVHVLLKSTELLKTLLIRTRRSKNLLRTLPKVRG